MEEPFWARGDQNNKILASLIFRKSFMSTSCKKSFGTIWGVSRLFWGRGATTFIFRNNGALGFEGGIGSCEEGEDCLGTTDLGFSSDTREFETCI